jgi:hypothetical protein
LAIAEKDNEGLTNVKEVPSVDGTLIMTATSEDLCLLSSGAAILIANGKCLLMQL